MSLDTTIGIRAKFKSSKSHRSDFDGERKPISNSDQIQSAQKWRLSIPPDSSHRDEAQHQTALKSDAGRTPTRHLFRRVPEVSCFDIKVFFEFSRHFRFICEIALWKTKDEDRKEMNKKTIGRSDNIRHERTLVAEQTSEFQRAIERGQKKRPEKRSQEGGHRGQEKRSRKRYRQMMVRAKSRSRTLSAFIATRRDKKNCPRNKAQDQSLEAATTTMMAVDESDVLLAISADEDMRETCTDGANTRRRIWQRNSPFRMADGRSMKVTGKAAREGRLKGYTDWRGVSKQEELLSDISQWIQSDRAQEMLWDTCGSLARHEKVQPVQDVMEKLKERDRVDVQRQRDVTGTSLFSSRYVMVISLVVHTREERWSHDDLQSDMDNALIDDRRIHVDFSQSVSKLWSNFRRGQSAKGKGCFKCGAPDHIAKDCTGEPSIKQQPSNYVLKNDNGQRGEDGMRWSLMRMLPEVHKREKRRQDNERDHVDKRKVECQSEDLKQREHDRSRDRHRHSDRSRGNREDERTRTGQPRRDSEYHGERRDREKYTEKRVHKDDDRRDDRDYRKRSVDDLNSGDRRNERDYRKRSEDHEERRDKEKYTEKHVHKDDDRRDDRDYRKRSTDGINRGDRRNERDNRKRSEENDGRRDGRDGDDQKKSDVDGRREDQDYGKRSREMDNDRNRDRDRRHRGEGR
ncbi:cyclophilin 59 [Actinidia rufa]|uniref:Peptidyl-prolyl cis-trans isomerase n=1 Tax=Actinidia rufa TaxID=165716 RepID=A0A7J0DLV9_9ERIC|nr:cyclophilin 59 [Actinidia rufa]